MRVVERFVRRLARSCWSLAAMALLAAAPAAAQESAVVSAAELNAALADHSAQVAADREVVEATLARPEVAEVASSLGVDIAEARTAARSLSGAELARAVAVSRSIDQVLAGGQTISFNATTLIIILLLVIIVVLIAE
jgi:hypothetical protein